MERFSRPQNAEKPGGTKGSAGFGISQCNVFILSQVPTRTMMVSVSLPLVQVTVVVPLPTPTM